MNIEDIVNVLKVTIKNAYELGYERAKSEFAFKWNENENVPEDGGTYLVVDQFGNVATYVRGIIRGNKGAKSDWKYESNVVAWAELPKYSLK